LATVLTGGAQAVSAGQRRRLLLARALLSPAQIVLLDEPTEHLDADDAESMLDALLDPVVGLFGRDRTVVVATHQRPAQGSGVSVHMEVTPEIGPLVLSGNGFQRQRASGDGT
jgi:ATP-binding cassette subfamily C protein CydC